MYYYYDFNYLLYIIVQIDFPAKVNVKMSRGNPFVCYVRLKKQKNK